MYPESRLHARGVNTSWLLFGDVKEMKLDATAMDAYRRQFTDTEMQCMIPVFQLEKSSKDNPEDNLVVPTLVVQCANRILSQTRTLHEIAIWWLAAHDLLSEFPDSKGRIRRDVSPRTALLDTLLSDHLIAAARRTIARDATFAAERAPRLALT